MPKPKPFSMNSRSTTRHNHPLALITASLLLLASGEPANAMSECEFIIRTMNKLGSRMSVLRMTTVDRRQGETGSRQSATRPVQLRLPPGQEAVQQSQLRRHLEQRLSLSSDESRGSPTKSEGIESDLTSQIQNQLRRSPTPGRRS